MLYWISKNSKSKFKKRGNYTRKPAWGHWAIIVKCLRLFFILCDCWLEEVPYFLIFPFIICASLFVIMKVFKLPCEAWGILFVNIFPNIPDINTEPEKNFVLHNIYTNWLWRSTPPMLPVVALDNWRTLYLNNCAMTFMIHCVISNLDYIACLENKLLFCSSK